MRKPSYKVVDGTEAVASILYRLNDLLLIDPAIPSPYFRDGLDLWVHEKKRNLRDRIPEIVLLPEGAWSPSLFTSGASRTILTVTERLPSLLAALREHPKGQRPPAILVASEKGYLPDAEIEELTLASSSMQEAADFCVLTEMGITSADGPIIHIFDADRLSREIQKIDCLSDDDLKTLVEGKKKYHISAAFSRFAEWTGRSYQPFDYEGDPEAEKVAVAMGPEAGTIREAIHLLKGHPEKAGLVTIRCLTPWDRKGLVEKIPGSVRTVFVPDNADLYFKVMDALHEGLVNRWSWFATLPKLSKVKSGRDVAGKIFSEIPPEILRNDRTIEVQIKDAETKGTIPFQRILLNTLEESLFGQIFLDVDPKDPGQVTIHIRVSPEPILSNEEARHPHPLPPLDSKLIARSIGDEAQSAVIQMTAVLHLILQIAREKGILTDIDHFINKWKQSIEEHLRPLGPFFVLQNLEAVERTLAGPSPVRLAPAQPDASAQVGGRMPLLHPDSPISLRSRVVTVLDEWPERPIEALGMDALLLPMIRESDLRKMALRYYKDYSQDLLPQNFRSPPSNSSLGLKPLLIKIAAIRSATKLPLIASLSAQIVDSWVSFGVEIQECGVDALEIVFEEAAWEKQPQDRNEVVRRLKQAVQIPLFVSLSSFDRDIPIQVEGLKASGADAIVLFRGPNFSDHHHTLGWISHLSGKTAIPLIAHGGFKTPDEVTQALCAGATWVQTETNDKS